MMKGMRIAILVAAAPLLFGQMCGAPTPVPEYGRLDVTPTLRAACAGWLTDPEIESFITGAEADRLDGFTKTQEIDVSITVCSTGGPALWSTCNTCLIAIVDQVYGE